MISRKERAVPMRPLLRTPHLPHYSYMGGCQNYDPSLGTLNIKCRIIIGTQKGTIILTTTHMLRTQHRPIVGGDSTLQGGSSEVFAWRLMRSCSRVSNYNCDDYYCCCIQL